MVPSSNSSSAAKAIQNAGAYVRETGAAANFSAAGARPLKSITRHFLATRQE
jgi:hypothetical protein